MSAAVNLAPSNTQLWTAAVVLAAALALCAWAWWECRRDGDRDD